MMTKEDGEASPVLEINLISAQGLLQSSGSARRVRTYALVWIDSSTKLRTGVDKFGGENPTWNDRFLFRVTPEFLSGDTSGIYVEIYAVGRIRDSLIGTVRLLISNFLDVRAKTPSFTALQIRRPSGRFHGVLNVGATVVSSSDFVSALANRTAIAYRDLMTESLRRRRGDRLKVLRSESENYSEESRESSRAESVDFSDGYDSSTSSSSTTSTALRDLNGIRELAGPRGLKAAQCSGFLCGLLLRRADQPQPCDEKPRDFDGPQEMER